MTPDLRVTVLEDEVHALRAELASVRIAVRGELAGEPQWRAALRRWARGETMAAALDAVVGGRHESP